MGNHNEQEVFSPTTKYGSVVYNGFSENATYLISFQKNLFFMGVVCTVVMNCKQPKKIFSMLTKNNIANDECKNSGWSYIPWHCRVSGKQGKYKKRMYQMRRCIP